MVRRNSRRNSSRNSIKSRNSRNSRGNSRGNSRRNSRNSRNSRRNSRNSRGGSKSLKGGSFAATIKSVLVPLFLLGANHKYKGKKTASKIRKKRRKIKNITMRLKGAKR